MEEKELKQLEFYKQIIESDTVKRLIASVEKKFESQADVEIKHAKATFWSFIAERGFYLVGVLLCLGAIVYLASNRIIDGTITGTLIGTVIGYTLAKASKTNTE